MAKAAVQFACTECGYSAGRWFGKCPGCDAFGSLVEEAPAAAAKPSAKPLLRLVDVDAEEATRISTGVPELDRVLGGGLVPASLVLVGGEPGVGKSTLLLIALGAISRDRRALLVTGEESVAQVKLRAARARAPRRLRPPVRGRPLPRAPHPAGRQEPVRLHQRAGRLRDDGGGARG